MTHELVKDILFYVSSFGLILLVPSLVILYALWLTDNIKDFIKKYKK